MSNAINYEQKISAILGRLERVSSATSSERKSELFWFVVVRHDLYRGTLCFSEVSNAISFG